MSEDKNLWIRNFMVNLYKADGWEITEARLPGHKFPNADQNGGSVSDWKMTKNGVTLPVFIEGSPRITQYKEGGATRYIFEDDK